MRRDVMYSARYESGKGNECSDNEKTPSDTMVMFGTE